MKKGLKICYFTSDTLSGCHYYRSAVPAKYLKRLGHSVDIRTDFPICIPKTGENAGKPCLVEDDIKQYDVIYFQRSYKDNPLYFVSMVKFAKENNIVVAYDIDDNYKNIPEHNPVYAVYGKDSTRKLIEFFIDNADVFTVTTGALRDMSKQARPIVFKNSLDFEVWDKAFEKRPVKRDLPTIGFAGGASHFQDLKMVEPVIRHFVESKMAHFVCMGIDPKFDFNYEFVPWNNNVARYPFHLAKKGFDIGICPLADDDFNDYKSNLKWLEYSSLKIATVASYKRPYYEIKHGINGMLCETIDDWYRNLTELLTKTKLRTYIANNAKTYVHKHYNAAENTAMLEDILSKKARR